MFEMMSESKKLPLHVKLWMGLMVLVFMAHLPFYTNTLHLINIIGFFGTAFVFGTLSFMFSKNINSLAVAHFIAWPSIIAIGVYYAQLGLMDLRTPADIILVSGYAIFAISLVLDYRILMIELNKSMLRQR